MMTPKFDVGDVVGVCTRKLNIIIPKTIVYEVGFNSSGIVNCGDEIIKINPHFTYLVEGNSFWLSEECLRKIDPDEYLDTIEEKTKELVDG